MAPADEGPDQAAPDAGASSGPEHGNAERHGAPMTTTHGQTVLHPSREQYTDVARSLRDEGFELCVDLTAVDYLTHRERSLPDGVAGQRFELVVVLVALESRERIRLRVQIPDSDPRVPSLFELHPGTEALEREVFDMFGITFDGHPDLTRILMPEDWEGHPLRKDYAVGRIPVQFKGAPGPR